MYCITRLIKSHWLPLNIEVEDPNVINQDCKGSISQVSGGLSQDLVQHSAVGFWKKDKSATNQKNRGEQPILQKSSELTSKSEEFLCVRWKIGRDVHGGRFSWKEWVQRWRCGRCKRGWGKWWRFVFNVRKLALPRVPDRRFALSLCGVDEEEGLHSRLENWKEEKKTMTAPATPEYKFWIRFGFHSWTHPVQHAGRETPPAPSGTLQACPTVHPTEAAHWEEAGQEASLHFLTGCFLHHLKIKNSINIQDFCWYCIS